jgi:hypothetical protein
VRISIGGNSAKIGQFGGKISARRLDTDFLDWNRVLPGHSHDAWPCL